MPITVRKIGLPPVCHPDLGHPGAQVFLPEVLQQDTPGFMSGQPIQFHAAKDHGGHLFLTKV
jgi:hypothetical protein